MKNDLRHLDFNLLKTFDALFDQRSVTAAAQQLYVTQPAVSGMLQRLRDYFDDPLFIRSQRGVNPTLRAIELAPHIKNILAEINTLIQPSHFDPLSREMTLYISATDYALQVILVPFIQMLRKNAPNIKVSITSVHDHELVAQLERGIIDFAITTSDQQHKELYQHDLFSEKYICLVHQNHPISTQKSLSLDDFCTLNYALVSHTGTAFKGITDEQLAMLNKTREVVVSVNRFLILPELLATTDLIAVVPSYLANNKSDFIQFDPPFSIPGFTKSIVWHERSHRDPAHKWLRHLLIQTAKNIDSTKT